LVLLYKGSTSMKQQLYGLWKSPVTSRALGGKLRLHDVQWDSDGETLVWLEGRGKHGMIVALTSILIITRAVA
jgi:hypothetical protein